MALSSLHTTQQAGLVVFCMLVLFRLSLPSSSPSCQKF
uniref:Uncharacterized protein n=1 Tax=Rhizophora mucronata TaxID=61149 RepID=A0A2P2NN51_RHIMU